MKRNKIVRLTLWFIAGAVFGLLIIGPMDDWLRRFPIIGDAVNILSMPASWLFIAWTEMGLPPHGDAGWGVMIFFIVAIWPIYGLLLGVLLEWRLMKPMAADQKQPRCQAPSHEYRLFTHTKQHKYFYTTAIVLLVAVCIYCISQNWALAKERKYYLEMMDRKAVAEAFYEIVSRPENHLQPFGSDSSRDPTTDPDVPEVVRLLKPKYLYMRGDGPSAGITLTQNNFTYLMLEHPFGDIGQYDLVYQEGPSSTDPRTILYSMTNQSAWKQNEEFGQQGGPGYPPQGVGSPDP